MKSNFKIILPTLLMCFLIWASKIQAQNPHILVSSSDKQTVLKKIENQAWAKSIYSEMEKEVAPYADRHQTDPQWILSRYLMNRVPEKRFTRVYSDDGGQRLVKWEGDAPVPTVRVNTYLRTPITEKGTSYRKPTIEELIPNDTAKLMNLFNPETNQKEWTDPHAYITSINGEINQLALDAAILFWLTGDDKYAKFASDILDQWAKGAYYQEPIIGPCRTGFLDMQTLGDRSYLPLILAYDFLKPYMQQQNYELHWYETVFEKFASTLAFRGFWNNNWYAAESSTLTFAALSLENKQKRDYYLQFILTKDTINGGCGQLAFPSTVEKWLTHDGHWKEPGGYHNFPVGNLLVSALALEKNGYDIFQKFPALFRASYAMLKYSFPNLTVGAFGDTGRASQSAESLEIGLVGAVKYNQPELPEMLASMKKLIDGGIYTREKSGYLGLLCFLPEIQEAKTDYHWPRTGTLDFAKLFVQRNGTDPKTGLMVGVQGATYNHNHCNGMAMELYGIGEVWGVDAGTGPNYEHPLHRNYYSQWAAHNTVVAAGMSSSVPFSGSAGTKQIGQIELAAMEPMPDETAISPNYSFTDTRYLDKSTNTNQSRTLGIVRTSEKTGYYVDIYRSDNSISNDYVYHNIGDAVTFLNEKREPLKTVEAKYPVTEKDYAGFRFYTEVKKLEKFPENLIARFSIKDENSKDLFMQALIAGNDNRDFYQAMSLKTKTAGKQYNGKPLPVFTIRTETEAKSHPFVVVFEPYQGEKGNTVERISVDKRTDSDVFTALTVYCKGDLKQQIFQSVDPNKKFTSGTGNFTGYYGITSFEGEKLTSIYLGKGSEISHSGYSLKSKNPDGSANLTINGKNLLVSCNQETEVGLPLTAKKVWLKQGSIRKELPVSMSGKRILATVPAVENGEIVLE
ncbi:MAG: heparinase II/III-family protein [Prolixibacteraceae bacterium]|nr:heparinase II/III-family protein [Prolixibacteraceae bacterium]